MKMTDEERFRFDLNGYLLRPAILSQDEIDAIIDQIDRIKHDPESLPPEHRAVPGGPSSVLIDHPMVIGVLQDIIGPEIRLESSFCIWRHKGQSAGGLHGGGPSQGDPIFGYRVRNGRIHAGMVRVAFELTAVSKEDGGTHFIPGSHKSNFPMHPDHMSLEDGKRSPFLTSYDCPAGSALFFTENLCHAGPEWKRDTPRVTVFNAYAHLATHWHRLTIPPAVLNALPREKQAYFREPWVADFRTRPATHNTIERFVGNDEPTVNTDRQP
ncbi:MAG: phytanoyl-CoA dioxygenase family protein [Candidatus Poribacteria bacterium]|nr:phytanoyl-CoA dioxygenase family protein [Candidatus Poribacteria bacterium]